jgi:hypothetical protein
MLFKYSGRIEPGSLRHSLKGARKAVAAEQEEGVLHVPSYAYDAWTQQEDIPQYAPTVMSLVRGFDPSGDCNGAFMSSNYQPNNNCYAYGCNIASNTFPQPGRATNGSVNLFTDDNFTAENVRANAILDGLRDAGETMASLTGLRPTGPGHLVALLFSPPVSGVGGDPKANWPGDYHWVRCDDPTGYSSWSQKNGADQVTNFDFAGKPITNPIEANWTANQGPIGGQGPLRDNNEFTTTYEFVCFMWVPYEGIHIV